MAIGAVLAPPALALADGGGGSKRTVLMQVLVMGMPRTALATALEALGAPCYHGFVLLANPQHCPQWCAALDWKVHGTPLPAADVGPDGRPSVAFWDRLLGAYGAVADLPAIFFVEELLAAYPAAKVVLVERDVETWYQSFATGVVRPMWSPLFRTLRHLDPYYVGPMSATADRWARGWFGATSRAAMEARCRPAYREHYAHVRRVTPPERLLEFELAEGWGPLCRFLGREAPDVAFPNTNDAAALQAKVSEYARQGVVRVLRRVLPWLIAVGIALLALNLYSEQYH